MVGNLKLIEDERKSGVIYSQLIIGYYEVENDFRGWAVDENG